MPIRVWINRPKKLPEQPLLRDGRRLQEGLRLGLEEVQDFAITSARNDDGRLRVDVEKNEIVINMEEEESSTAPDFQQSGAVDGDIFIFDASTNTWIPASTEEVTVVTDVQYDSGTKQLQKKTRAVTVLTPGTESGWTLITGGQAEDCPE